MKFVDFLFDILTVIASVPQLLKENKDKPVELLVWNIKSQEKREVQLVPNDDWPGAGLLGVTIRLDDYGGADERLIRVLEVEQNSPASIAGLVPLQDYLLGTTAASFESTATLASVLHEHCDMVVEIYVYNSESDIVRVVSLMPTLSWGNGGGLLGAEVGVGYLHRLPNHCRDTIGQSVERKVKYKKEDKEDEVEPSVPVMEGHLEMEIEGDKKPEDVSKQPHELGSACEGQEQDPKEIEPAVKTKEEQEDDSSSSRPEEQSMNQKIAALQPAKTEPASANAATLFAGPPPGVTSAKVNTNTKEQNETESQEETNGSQSYSYNLPNLPSPPKMHY